MMLVGALCELCRTVIHVEPVGHVAAKLSNEESIFETAVELDCILQPGDREAAPPGSNGAHDCRSRANYIDGDDCMRINKSRCTGGKAIDHDSTRHVTRPPQLLWPLASAAASDSRRRRSEDRGGRSRRAALLR